MSVGTGSHSALPPGFLERDLRDPALLGELLLRLNDVEAPLSQTYDRYARLAERVPAWSDDLMSNDPAQHHSKTSQTPAPGGSK